MNANIMKNVTLVKPTFYEFTKIVIMETTPPFCKKCNKFLQNNNICQSDIKINNCSLDFIDDKRIFVKKDI